TPAGVDAKAPVGLAKKPALNVVQPVQLNLPLPRGVEHSDFLQFETAHSEIMAAYQPLSKEWLLFAKSFSKGRRASEEEVAALRIRVRENLAGTHWLFVWGVQQTSIMLLGNNPQKSFLIDRQQDFLERMNLLLFITGELQAAKMRADYRGFLRDFYKHANAKFFKRPLRDRSPRPESLIRPDSNPNSSE
ncbi:hypothetical protein EBU99_02315, partial [bacterium]|nr:hypothetical protein [bacterium]